MPVFQGADKENGERRDIVRPRLASRLISIFLAVQAAILRVSKTNRCALWDSLGENLRNIETKAARHTASNLEQVKSECREDSGENQFPESSFKKQLFNRFQADLRRQFFGFFAAGGFFSPPLGLINAR